MQSLRYRFKLATPLSTVGNKPNAPLMFDSLLGYAWAIKNGLTKTPHEEIATNLIFPELPIEKISERCYAASAAFIPPNALSEPTIFMRHADHRASLAAHGIKGIYQTSSGYQQAVQEIYWLTLTPHVDFYVRGDKKEINELLSIIWDLRHLGSRRGSGYGLITDITIDETKPDYSVWKGNKPTRPIPCSIAGERPDLIREWATHCAPYWHQANADWCYMPPPEQYLPFNSEQIATSLEDNFKNVASEYQDKLRRIELAVQRRKEAK